MKSIYPFQQNIMTNPIYSTVVVKKFLISPKIPFLSVQLEGCLKSRVALLLISATVIRLIFKGTFMPYE